VRHTTLSSAPKLWWRWVLVWCLAICCAVGLAACTINVGPPQVVSAKDAINVPIQVRHTATGGVDIMVDIMIDGQGPFTFVVDTGAESSLIDTNVALQLRLQSAGRPHQIGGVGGSEEAVPVAISQWSMGTVRLPAATIDSANVQDLSKGDTVGLLGSDILSQFGNVTINYDLKTLSVYKQIA
jgi:predicted aspartyl protease